MDERVLLVEDGASIREVVGIGLRRAGNPGTGIGDGLDALAMRNPSTAHGLLRIFDAHLHLLGRRVVSMECIEPCPPEVMYRNHMHFSAAGLQQGYVVVSPAHAEPGASGTVVQIPITLNGS